MVFTDGIGAIAIQDRRRLAKCDRGAAIVNGNAGPFTEDDLDAFAFALHDELRCL
jgi:hypothetical protein